MDEAGSDSENDLDYVPQADEEASSSSEDEKPAKRARADLALSAEVEDAKKKALWESFQASVNDSGPRSESVTNKTVKICKRYLFAGEEVTEVVEIPEDSPDAKKWPALHPPDMAEGSVPTTAEQLPPQFASSGAKISGMPTTTGKRPGPRKPKTRLSELPGPSSSKAQKITTLDKSVMDWKSHTQSSENAALQEELELNRRSGGYLEKVEFLQRVDERKDTVLDAATRSKRKRG